MVKIGAVLSGCGFLDGSEIHESVSTLLAISRQGAAAVCMAPDAAQVEVINYISGEPVKESRNILAESARIARGKIQNIKNVKADDLDALIFPGGYGAAKNLCGFASKGLDCEVNPEVARLAREIHKAGKPIGAICIAPALIAKIFQGSGFTLTIGNDRETAAAIENLGHTHQNCGVKETCVDRRSKIVTTPAYMYDANPAEIFVGIEKLVREVINLSSAFLDCHPER